MTTVRGYWLAESMGSDQKKAGRRPGVLMGEGQMGGGQVGSGQMGGDQAGRDQMQAGRRPGVLTCGSGAAATILGGSRMGRGQLDDDLSDGDLSDEVLPLKPQPPLHPPPNHSLATEPAESPMPDHPDCLWVKKRGTRGRADRPSRQRFLSQHLRDDFKAGASSERELPEPPWRRRAQEHHRVLGRHGSPERCWEPPQAPPASAQRAPPIGALVLGPQGKRKL